MKISVDEIPTSGTVVSFSQRDAWAADAAVQSLDRQADPLDGTLALHRANQKGVVKVDVDCRAEADALCDRCGQPCSLALEGQFTLLFAPEESEGNAFDGGEIELDTQDLDVGWYADRRIECSEIVREALALMLPQRLVCADVAECDRRTADLLSSASAGTSEPSAFAMLRDLVTRRDGSEDMH